MSSPQFILLGEGHEIPERLQVLPGLFIPRRDPYYAYAALLERGPVLRTPYGVVMVVGHPEVAAVLKDSRMHIRSPFGSARKDRDDEVEREGSSLGELGMIFSNGADHARRRAFMTRAFQPRMLEALVPKVQVLLDEALDRAAKKGRIDLIEDLALPFPVRVIAVMLGVPRKDHRRCRLWSEALAPVVDAVVTAHGYDRAVRAAYEFKLYMKALMARRRAEPEDDLITQLAAYVDREGELSEDEVVANLVTLFVAGHETTTNLLGNAIVLLHRHRDQRALLAEKSELLESMIEETLRYEPSVQSTFRIAQDDTTLAGVEIARGTVVSTMIAAANRDPRRFDDPMTYDITRSPNPHLAFGSGLHFCMGAALARMEARLALGAFLERFPRWRLAEQELELRPTMNLRGYKRLRLELY